MSQTVVMAYDFHVNSSQRQTGINTDFTISTNQVINLLSKRGQFQIIFNSAQIPFTFYQLNSTDSLNIITCTFKNAVDASAWTSTIALPEGNYTPYTLGAITANALQNAALNPPPGYTPFGSTYTLDYDVSTGYLSFQITGVSPGTIVTLKFSTSPNKNTAGFFGINTVTPTDVVMTYNTAPTSTQPCVLNPINYLLIRGTFKQFRNREWITVADDVSDILYKVPIQGNQSTWINYYEPSDAVYIVDSVIQTMNFYLTTNLSYSPINLQKIPWGFSFSIREVLRPDYVALNDNHILYTPITTNTAEELKQLLDEKKKNLDKLEMYKKKLGLNGQMA